MNVVGSGMKMHNVGGEGKGGINTVEVVDGCRIRELGNGLVVNDLSSHLERRSSELGP